jgi:hypothetical protein
MSRPRDTIAVTPVALVVSIVCVLVGLLSVGAGADPRQAAGVAVDATVSSTPGRTIPPGFLGLSLETSAIESYAGTNPAAPSPLFLRLVGSLTPGASPVIRIGGDTADWSWWPVPGLSRPRGVYITLDRTWVAETDAIARALGARLILGLNLEADSAAIAATEAANMRAGIPDSRILAFELGNEPSIYGRYPWYRVAGKEVTGRPRSWDFASYLADFTRIASAVDVPAFAGPSVGGPGWFPNLPALLAAAPRIRVVTVHQYPFQLCRTSPSSPRHPTVARLLAPSGSSGFAARFASAVAVAHARGLPLRIDELNTVSCGATPTVSRSFASALWALDTLFGLARTGVDGVQMHTFPGAGYELFTMHRSRGGGSTASVSPEYYGLLMFAGAAPAGSRLLPVSRRADPQLAVWATMGRDGRTRVLLINKDASRARTVRLRVPGARAGAPATIVRLSAPALTATSGVTLAGRRFAAQTATGHLTGRRVTTTVRATGGRYVVAVPAGSAALATIG